MIQSLCNANINLQSSVVIYVTLSKRHILRLIHWSVAGISHTQPQFIGTSSLGLPNSSSLIGSHPCHCDSLIFAHMARP